jgi:phosphatidylglycerol:prolipoprotein diacylglycerol transferase
MHPILFTIPGIDFPIRSFGVMFAAAFLVGSWIFNKLIARYSLQPAKDVERYGVVPMWILVGIVVGARLMYVIVEIARGSSTGKGYLENPLLIFAVWEGGMVMYGGLIGGIVGGAWCVKKHDLRFWHGLDIGLTAAFFGQVLGRVGCLLVGDDYGAVVPEKWQHAPWSWLQLRVPDPLPPHSLFGEDHAGQVLWATQPMMSLKALIVALIALWLLPRRRYEGQVALVAILSYSVLRFGVEFLRGDEVRGVWFGNTLSTSQLISIAAALFAVAMLVKNRGRYAPHLPPAKA